MTQESKFYEILAAESGFRSVNSIQFFLNTIFREISFEGKTVLDIGGGIGLLALYAANRGARDAVCLEPESAGSTHGAKHGFERVRTKLTLTNVRFIAQTFQEFVCEDAYFDIVVLYNSINHLDEKSCSELQSNLAASASYTVLFAKLGRICRPGATVIICDCSNRNFFPDLGMSNPLHRDINYSIHQQPETWAGMLMNAGFVRPKVWWSSYNVLGRLGQLVLGHRIPSYFLSSHFCMRMEKAVAAPTELRTMGSTDL